ncbi:unnamed protein product [Bursaphelenchus okinawaensis]|uniref:Amine oxidase domain-containing protein n=1 Tax=Bursaphelenchus okinawaensis TaxID=465554 RepID=A0A811JRW0_9BILA|nr:unnamed protein product [Bursaphelenchus okinawaensis]CAG9080036.1 unnamed protein product [Bursaphelenchus okinawaensis]
MANLERRLGAPLKEVSALDWAGGVGKSLKGECYIVDDGISRITSALAIDLNVQRLCSVYEIRENKLGEDSEMEVKYQKTVKSTKNHVDIANYSDDSDVEFIDQKEEDVEEADSYVKADICVCAVPVGVLKERVPRSKSNSVASSERDQSASTHNSSDSEASSKLEPKVDNIKFYPELPGKYKEAIERIGVGTTNKVLLQFSKRFWPDSAFIGRLSNADDTRGEFVVFFSKPRSTNLYAYLTGEAAHVNNYFEGEFIAQRVMNVLSSMFTHEVPPKPKKVIVTDWFNDAFSQGSAPFVRRGCALFNDYDFLAQPLSLIDTKSAPKLFLTGDYTTSKYPGTLHGAYLAGLRCARQIADNYLGPVNDPEVMEELNKQGRFYMALHEQRLRNMPVEISPAPSD